MRNYIAMKKLAIVLGLVMLMSTQFRPSSAQLNLPGDCWKDIITCGNGAETEQEFAEDCCSILEKQVTEATMCLCSVQPILDMDPAVADAVSQFLSMCRIDSPFNAIYAGSAPSPSGASAPMPSLPCWEDLETCIRENEEKKDTMPQFNASSSEFKVTEYLCCPHVQEIAETKKPCFCSITDALELQPSMTPSVMQVVANCKVAESVLELKDFCEGVVAGSLAPGPNNALGPAADGNKSADSQEGAANKIITVGSVSSLIVS